MDLTEIMDWDGTAATGLVNPVTNRAPFQNAVLGSGGWSVRFEVDVNDPSGRNVHCIADGRLGWTGFGSDLRTLAGAWNCEGVGDGHAGRDPTTRVAPACSTASRRIEFGHGTGFRPWHVDVSSRPGRSPAAPHRMISMAVARTSLVDPGAALVSHSVRGGCHAHTQEAHPYHG